MIDTTEYRSPCSPLVSPGGIERFEQDMTVTVSADVSLRELQQNLSGIRQWLPIDGNPDSSMSELVEGNSTGPLRLGYGAWRDLLLGCQFTNRRGELITAGGRAIKNVAGYDLTKLMVGQQGALGKMVTITTRTYKRPSRAMIVRFTPDRDVVNRLLPSVCRPQWMILNAEGLYAGYLGEERMIDFIDGAMAGYSPMERERMEPGEEMEKRTALWEIFVCEGGVRGVLPVRMTSEEHGRDAHATLDDHATGFILFRASVPPARVVEFVAKAKLTKWVADAAFGIVRGGCRDEEWGLVCESAIAVGGRAWETPGSNDLTPHPVLRRLIDSFAHRID